MKLLHLVSASILVCLNSQALALSYKCQISAQPALVVENVQWDGKAGFAHPFSYRNEEATFRVQDINLPGHPELVLDVFSHGRSLISSSQKKDLKEYSLIWRSDVDEDSLITVMCRRAVN